MKDAGFYSKMTGSVSYVHIIREGKKLYYRFDHGLYQEIKTDGYFADDALQIDGGQFLSKSDVAYPHRVKNVKFIVEFEDEDGYVKKLVARSKPVIQRIFEVFPMLKESLK